VKSRVAPITVWCGDYRFGEDNSFFPSVVKIARKYVDKELRTAATEVHFREALEALRRIAPFDGKILLDQLEHRWKHPDCPPSLYVLTCTLCAPDRGALLDHDANLVQELVCTKVGQAKRTVAARFPAYKTQVLGGVRISEGSQSLRVMIYGDGSAMPLEREIQQFARNVGSRAEVAENGAVRYVGDETYVGVEMADAICAFARQRRAA
jgi:hypothetical protein